MPWRAVVSSDTAKPQLVSGSVRQPLHTVIDGAERIGDRPSGFSTKSCGQDLAGAT